MGAVQKLSIAVTEQQARDIEAAIASGAYSTTSEVIRDALRAWQRERLNREAAIERLRRLYEEGLASGEPVEGGFDARDMMQRWRQRQEKEGRAAE